ncbi:MAG: enoyl-CoA hydratase [Hyphomicrobiales bacterium]
MTEDIFYATEDGIGTITFNRPQARNALTFEMYDALEEMCSAIKIVDISVLIITGAGGKAFAAGTDISRFRDFTTPQHALNYEKRMDEVLCAIEKVSVPVIAAIEGACTGGGAAIAACCDMRIARADMKYGFPIARTLGNCLSARNLARQANLLGEARVKDLIFSSRLMEADEAQTIGFISEIAEDPYARARAVAAHMATHAPLTMRATKEAFRRLGAQAAKVDDTDLITQCYTSDDFREGLEAFLGKRKPEWKGE